MTCPVGFVISTFNTKTALSFWSFLQSNQLATIITQYIAYSPANADCTVIVQSTLTQFRIKNRLFAFLCVFHNYFCMNFFTLLSLNHSTSRRFQCSCAGNVNLTSSGAAFRWGRLASATCISTVMLVDGHEVEFLFLLAVTSRPGRQVLSVVGEAGSSDDDGATSRAAAGWADIVVVTLLLLPSPRPSLVPASLARWPGRQAARRGQGHAVRRSQDGWWRSAADVTERELCGDLDLRQVRKVIKRVTIVTWLKTIPLSKLASSAKRIFQRCHCTAKSGNKVRV